MMTASANCSRSSEPGSGPFAYRPVVRRQFNAKWHQDRGQRQAGTPNIA